MTNANDNTNKQLDFPYRIVDPKDHDKVTALEVVSSIRLKTAAYLNRRTIDGTPIPQTVAQAIRKANIAAIDEGLPPIVSPEELETL